MFLVYDLEAMRFTWAFATSFKKPLVSMPSACTFLTKNAPQAAFTFVLYSRLLFLQRLFAHTPLTTWRSLVVFCWHGVGWLAAGA